VIQTVGVGLGVRFTIFKDERRRLSPRFLKTLMYKDGERVAKSPEEKRSENQLGGTRAWEDRRLSKC